MMSYLSELSPGDSEIVDLERMDTSCDILPKYPINYVVDTFGFTYNSLPMVCGGLIDYGTGQYEDDCNFYDYENGAWFPGSPMPVKLASSALLKLGYQEFWVLGGQSYDGDKHIAVETTMIFKDGQWSMGSNLPEPMNVPSAVNINSTHGFVASAWTSTDIWSNKTFMVDFTKANEWIPLPDIPVPAENWSGGHSSGTFINSSGEQEIVVAGVNSTWVFNLSGWNWRQGPDLPVRLYGATAAQYDDHFLLVGGFENGKEDREAVSDKIYLWDSRETWITLATTLTAPGELPAVFKISDDNANCV